MDVGAIKNLVKQELSNNIGSTVFFSEAELLNAINDAYKDIALRTFCSEVKDTITTTAGIDRYRWSGYRINKVTKGYDYASTITPDHPTNVTGTDVTAFTNDDGTYKLEFTLE